MNIRPSNYHPNWQINRINFVLSKYPKEFFKGKRILELGPFNGFIGAYFQSLGADVHSIEGREENVLQIKSSYPELSVEQYDLDTNEWKWGKWDIIINFGLYYHLENFHREHLLNCLDNCDLMFFESVIFDSYDSEIHVRIESGIDQSLTSKGGTPSTKYVEDIFNEKNVKYTKYTDYLLNGNDHRYDWPDSNSKILFGQHRRFWIVEK